MDEKKLREMLAEKPTERYKKTTLVGLQSIIAQLAKIERKSPQIEAYLQELRVMEKEKALAQIAERNDLKALLSIRSSLETTQDKEVLKKYREKADACFKTFLEDIASQVPSIEKLKLLLETFVQFSQISDQSLLNEEFDKVKINMINTLISRAQEFMDDPHQSFKEKLAMALSLEEIKNLRELSQDEKNKFDQTNKTMIEQIIIAINSLVSIKPEVLLKQSFLPDIQSAIKKVGGSISISLDLKFKEVWEKIKTTLSLNTILHALKSIESENISMLEKLSKLNNVMANGEGVFEGKLPAVLLKIHHDIYQNIIMALSREVITGSRQAFQSVKFKEMMNVGIEKAFSGNEKERAKAPTFIAWSVSFDAMTEKVLSSVKSSSNPEFAGVMAKAWVEVADRCLAEGDFFSALAISAAFAPHKIGKETATTLRQSPEHQSVIDKINHYIEDSSYQGLRNEEKVLFKKNKEIVPFPGLITKDINFYVEGNASNPEKAVAIKAGKEKILNRLEGYQNKLSAAFNVNKDPFSIEKCGLLTVRKYITVLKKMSIEGIVNYMIEYPERAEIFLKKRPKGFAKLMGFNLRKELFKVQNLKLIDKMIENNLADEIMQVKLLDSKYLAEDLRGYYKTKLSQKPRGTSSNTKNEKNFLEAVQAFSEEKHHERELHNETRQAFLSQIEKIKNIVLKEKMREWVMEYINIITSLPDIKEVSAFVKEINQKLDSGEGLNYREYIGIISKYSDAFSCLQGNHESFPAIKGSMSNSNSVSVQPLLSPREIPNALKPR